MRIKTKLYLSSLISVVLITALILIMFLTSDEISKHNAQRSSSRQVLQTVSELDILTYDYLLHHEKRAEQQWQSSYISLGKLLASFTSTDDEEKEAIDRLSKNYNSIKNSFSELKSIYEKGQSFIQEGSLSQEEIAADISAENRLTAQLLITSQLMVSETSLLAEKNVSGMLEAQTLNNRLTLALGTILLLNGIITTFAVNNVIAKSLHTLHVGTDEIGKGNLDYKIDIENKDEIGQVAKAFNRMTDNLRTVIATKTELEKEIGKRKKAQEQMREVIRVTEAGYYEHAVDYSSGLISEKFAEILGFKLKELPKYPRFAKWFAKRIHKEDFQEFNTLAEDFYHGKTVRFEDEYRVLAKNGKWVWLQVVSAPLRKDSKGLPLYIAGLIFNITKHKFTEEALKESESRLSKTQEIAHLGTWGHDYTSNLTYWSDETYRLYGYKLREVRPSHITFNAVVHPEDRKRVAAIYYDSLKSGQNGYTHVFRIINKSTGKIRIIQEKCEHIRNKSGKIINSIGMVQDITERKYTEQALEETRNYLERLINYANAPIIVWDPNLKITKFNHAFEQMTNYKESEVVGKNLEILFPEKNRTELLKKIRRTMAGEHWNTVEIPIRQKSGEIRIALWNSANIYNQNKSTMSTIAQGQDITERKKVEEALRDNEEKFRAVAETAKDAIISANSYGNITYFNKGAEQIFGYSASEVFGKPLTVLMPQQLQKAHQHGFSRFLETKKSNIIGKTVEIIGKRKNGKEFPIELSLATWNLSNEIYFTAIIRDITERKNLDQRKDDFITIAGHELRTPVSAIKIMNQILHDMLADNPQALKYLNKIENQVTIQANLIDDLLNVSKIQTGKLELRKEQFDLQTLVEETVEDMQETTKTHKIIIKGKIYGRIFADREKIGQVLINFCSNAIKFSPNKGKVTVELKNGRKEAVVGVTDYGIGIPREHHGRIFDRFYRVYGRGDKQYPGLGMGLYISYEIIKLLNGKMWFESQPGKGSTFYFSLPLQT